MYQEGDDLDLDNHVTDSQIVINRNCDFDNCNIVGYKSSDVTDTNEICNTIRICVKNSVVYHKLMDTLVLFLKLRLSFMKVHQFIGNRYLTYWKLMS